MAYPDYERDLLAPTFDPIEILDRYFHSGQSYVFWQAPPHVEPRFKAELARRLRDCLQVQLHPLQLILCGSAHLGFSPVPTKLGKPFDSKTPDIDVAIVSPELFERWWRELQTVDLVPSVLSRVADDLFHGFISPANVRNESAIGRDWWSLFGKMETDRANGVRGRLYRDYWSMQSYHIDAINRGRDELRGKRRLVNTSTGADR